MSKQTRSLNTQISSELNGRDVTCLSIRWRTGVAEMHFCAHYLSLMPPRSAAISVKRMKVTMKCARRADGHQLNCDN